MNDSPMMSVIHAKMDLLELASLCESLVGELLEAAHHPTRMALCGKLLCALESLKYVLDSPVPAHCVQALTGTAEEVRSMPFLLGAESQTLRQYCASLTLVLLSGTLLEEDRQIITGLLFDLVNHLRDDIHTPCFIKTPEGIVNMYGDSVETFSWA
ncbi:hypothetical protein [Mangrovibacter plantisponsor]|uniref:Uncharacterized protein n=1 Tax=Mangrovibacter plantisponsor TaxID=451513 RepID=A0A317PXR6_9ENTR|nr:hypothetical protein [Mangrovibacter plantisponsor]PWW05871.1 hypothetical protein DES37_112135 [Mangrovibacter plantisponsor]